MTGQNVEELVATVDVNTLQTGRWGLIRVFFPRFVDDIELGRFVRTLLAEHHYGPVHIERHRDADGSLSTHIFDVFTAPARGA